jgi:uncharacterized membrane protein
MYRVVIEKAKQEAQAFITSCDQALEQLDKENEGRYEYDPTDKRWTEVPRQNRPADYSYGSAATGALRRKSMDMTRILADLRRR